jgi:hypothetical protein
MAHARAGRTEEASGLFFEARNLRATADALERLSQPQGRGKPSRVTSSARRRMSEASGSENPLVEVANAAGHTLVTLAEVVAKRMGTKFSHAILSKAPRGERPVRTAVAAIVQQETVSAKYPKGYEAIPRNWRGGIKD